MPKNTPIPPAVEYYISEKREEARAENRLLFAAKWVEKALVWSLYGLSAAVVSVLAKAIAPLILK